MKDPSLRSSWSSGLVTFGYGSACGSLSNRETLFIWCFYCCWPYVPTLPPVRWARLFTAGFQSLTLREIDMLDSKLLRSQTGGGRVPVDPTNQDVL